MSSCSTIWIKFLRTFVIFAVIFSWIFSGWPVIWQNPRIPPKIQEAQATWGVPKIGAIVTVAALVGNITLTEPTGIAQGDLMVATIAAKSNYAFTLPTGWALVATQQSSGDVDATAGVASGVMAYIVRGASAPNLTFTRSASADVAHGRITSYSGSYTAPYDTGSSATTLTSVTPTTASINTAQANELLVAMVACGDNYLTSAFDAATDPTTASGVTDTTTAPTAGTWIERSDAGTNTGADTALATADAIRGGAGLTGALQATVATAAGHVLIVGAFKMAVAPTVTTQVASNVQETTATGNGNITDTGGVNATAWGVCYKTSTGCTTADSVAAGSGTGGTGAFTASMTSLSAGTTYYIKAYATNPAGTSYGSEVTTTTKPAAPTSVAATDGTYTDKVTITWTKSTGATNYNVWRDAVDLGAAGDVATFDDTGAGAPTITPGSASASDGTNVDYVSLSLSGASANNGATYTYKVVASNTTGNSADSATDTGYRGVGSLTYQWQRSTADSDASYSDITGATTASYNDTGAPADGSGRYFKVVENATGATQQTSTADRGYRDVAVYSVSITSDGFVAYGFVPLDGSKSTIELPDTQNATNSGNVTAKFNIKTSNATSSGSTWTLGSATGTLNVFTHQFATSSGWVKFAATDVYQTLVEGVTQNGSQSLDLRIGIPSSVSDYQQKTIYITIQAAQP